MNNLNLNAPTMLDQVITLFALGFLFFANFGVALAAEPIAKAPAGHYGQPTTFQASGSIDRINKRQAVINFFADAPFWGPPRYGGRDFYLWPKDTAFTLFVPGPTPITIEGKKAGFADLMVGQQIEVHYNVTGWDNSCVAYRITAHTVKGAFSPDGNPHSSRLVGHWRYGGPNVLTDYWFAADGTFKNETAEPGKLYTCSGRWSLAGNKLNYEIITSNVPHFGAGTKDQDKLLQLTKDYYVLENRSGSQHRYVRQK